MLVSSDALGHIGHLEPAFMRSLQVIRVEVPVLLLVVVDQTLIGYLKGLTHVFHQQLRYLVHSPFLIAVCQIRPCLLLTSHCQPRLFHLGARPFCVVIGFHQQVVFFVRGGCLVVQLALVHQQSLR